MWHLIALLGTLETVDAEYEASYLTEVECEMAAYDFGKVLTEAGFMIDFAATEGLNGSAYVKGNVMTVFFCEEDKGVDI